MIKIRKMKLGDHIDLKGNLFKSMDINDIKNDVEKSVKHMQDNGNWIYLVAEVKGKVVGTIYLEVKTNNLKKHIGELYSIVVSEDYRRMGIAKMMIEKVIEIAKEKKLEYLILSVRKGTIADMVYPKLGFIKYGELPNGIKEDDNTYFNQNLYYLKVFNIAKKVK